MSIVFKCIEQIDISLLDPQPAVCVNSVCFSVQYVYIYTLYFCIHSCVSVLFALSLCLLTLCE